MKMMRGIVHDWTARRMGGVAGHAGLFSTAADLSIYCRMLLDGGRYNGVADPVAARGREDDVARHRSRRAGRARPRAGTSTRRYSSNRGELLPLGSYGHTGFTGTSLWIDPATREFVIFLSNRVHPDGKGDVTPLRAQGRDDCRLGDERCARDDRRARPMTGRDFGRRRAPAAPRRSRAGARPASTSCAPKDFAPLRRQAHRSADQSHRTRARRRDGDRSARSPRRTSNWWRSSAPSTASAGARRERRRRPSTRRPSCRSIRSTARRQRPTAAMLDGLDAMVIDLQDIGARFWTYMTTWRT